MNVTICLESATTATVFTPDGANGANDFSPGPMSSQAGGSPWRLGPYGGLFSRGISTGAGPVGVRKGVGGGAGEGGGMVSRGLSAGPTRQQGGPPPRA